MVTGEELPDCQLVAEVRIVKAEAALPHSKEERPARRDVRALHI
jgi:hypothetical protein